MVFVFRFSLCVLVIQGVVSKDIDYRITVIGCKANDAPLWTFDQRSAAQCLALCTSDYYCKSVSYNSYLAQCIGMNVLNPSCPNFTPGWNFYRNKGGYIILKTVKFRTIAFPFIWIQLTLPLAVLFVK